MVPVLVAEGRKPEVEDIGIDRSLSQDLLIGSLLLFVHRLWRWHHTAGGRQLALEEWLWFSGGLRGWSQLLFLGRRGQSYLVIEQIQNNLAVLRLSRSYRHLLGGILLLLVLLAFLF